MGSVRLDLRKIEVMVVDDNQHSLDLLSQVLGGFRFKKIQATTSAEEARTLVTTQRYDLIIIDAEMPNDDGFRLTNEIRARIKPNGTAPIILISGFTPFAKVSRARDVGANVVLKKPISPSVLISRIEWIAQNDRAFVSTETYRGPDRRFRMQALSDGQDERRADALALAATPERAMSQGDIDSLFG